MTDQQASQTSPSSHSADPQWSNQLRAWVYPPQRRLDPDSGVVRDVPALIWDTRSGQWELLDKDHAQSLFPPISDSDTPGAESVLDEPSDHKDIASSDAADEASIHDGQAREAREDDVQHPSEDAGTDDRAEDEVGSDDTPALAENSDSAATTDVDSDADGEPDSEDDSEAVLDQRISEDNVIGSDISLGDDAESAHGADSSEEDGHESQAQGHDATEMEPGDNNVEADSLESDMNDANEDNGDEPEGQVAEERIFDEDDSPRLQSEDSAIVEEAEDAGVAGDGDAEDAGVAGDGDAEDAGVVSDSESDVHTLPPDRQSNDKTAVDGQARQGEEQSEGDSAHVSPYAASLYISEGSVERIDTPVIIGRRPQANDQYPDAQPLPIHDTTKSMSKIHAVITPIKDGVEVRDLGSTNGTWITFPGGQRLHASEDTPLKATFGSSLHCGNCVITVRAD